MKSRHLSITPWFLAGALFWVPAKAADVNSVSANLDRVPRYEKLELSVNLTASFSNPYDPEQIDLWAEFTSPGGASWKIWGFYDGTDWKVRFAANETGTWHYVVKAKDSNGTGKSASGTFSCTASDHHGWIQVSPVSKRYFRHDDGTSFYGIGGCYPWEVTSSGLDNLAKNGSNIFVYWNSTYDGQGNGGGRYLIESELGRYDQRKARRIDELIEWSEARNLAMILVIWPHDWLCENMGGWPSNWDNNPYRSITSCDNFYSSSQAWTYQEKQYRYLIARWGYSRALGGWQTVCEVSGTCGWSNQASANAWAKKITDFLRANDLFKHPTNGSQHGGGGSYWTEGYRVHDVSNRENYYSDSYTAASDATKKMWADFEKPNIHGEFGASSGTAHDIMWAALGSGAATTPLFWKYPWDATRTTHMSYLAKFVADIDFANTTSLKQGTATVSGARVYFITGSRGTFGWIISESGNVGGNGLRVTGMANGRYDVEWFDCWTGNTVSRQADVTIDNGEYSAAIPALSRNDIAFKILSTTANNILARFTVSGECGSAPLEVAVDASGTVPSTGLAYAWDFGDGSSGSGKTATHTYTKAGTFTITLTVSDGDDEGSTTAEVSASDPAAEPAVRTVNDDQTGTCLKQFDFSSGWQATSGGDQFQGDEHYTGTSGESYTFRFYGSQVVLYGTIDAHHGIATASIDGGTEEQVDFYSATRATEVAVWTSPALTPGEHAVTLTATGRGNSSSSGTVVTADKAEVRQSAQATVAGMPGRDRGSVHAKDDQCINVVDLRGRLLRVPGRGWGNAAAAVRAPGVHWIVGESGRGKARVARVPARLR